MTDTTTTPQSLYNQAAGDLTEYRRLLEEHGHIIPRQRDAEGRPVYSPDEMERRRADPLEALAATVHAAWRDGMLAQGRTVAQQRLHWATLTEEDRALDRVIASEVLRVIGSLASYQDGRGEPCWCARTWFERNWTGHDPSCTALRAAWKGGAA